MGPEARGTLSLPGYYRHSTGFIEEPFFLVLAPAIGLVGKAIQRTMTLAEIEILAGVLK